MGAELQPDSCAASRAGPANSRSLLPQRRSLCCSKQLEEILEPKDNHIPQLVFLTVPVA